MEREFYLDLAERGVRLPIAAHLILHQRENPAACRLNGDCLGRVNAGRSGIGARERVQAGLSTGIWLKL